MTLKEVGIVIGKKLLTRRRAIRINPVMVSFKDTEVKTGGLLTGWYGEAKSVKKAKANYCKRIRGQILVTDAMLKTRKETQLPPRITVK